MDHDTQRITLLKALLDDNPQYRPLEIPTDRTKTTYPCINEYQNA